MLDPREELPLVIGLLTDAISNTPSPRSTLCSPFPPEFAAMLRVDINLAGPMAEEAIRLCVTDAFQHDPAWLELLLSLVPEVEVIAKIKKRLRNPPPASDDPLDALLLATDMPFLNRTVLRKRLKVLSNPQSLKPILVVTGPKCSGKSYSTMLIEHFCGSQASLLHCKVPLPDGQEDITGPREIASDLVAQMGGQQGTMPLQVTSEDRWIQELAIWVLREAVGTPHNWWLVLDGFNRPGLRPDSRKFIDHLAHQVTNGIFARRCRVILLDFDRTALTVQPGKVLLEEIAPVGEPEVTACVGAILRRAGQNADARAVASTILQDLPDDPSRMIVLNERLLALLEATEALDA